MHFKKKLMSELVVIFQSSYLYEIEIAKTKLESREIPSYIKNEYVNNIAVFPISQNYYLLINKRDFQRAEKVLQEKEDFWKGPHKMNQIKNIFQD